MSDESLRRHAERFEIVLFDNPKFNEFARRQFGNEPNPELFPLQAHEWRTKIGAAYEVWVQLGLMWHDGKLPFAPRDVGSSGVVFKPGKPLPIPAAASVPGITIEVNDDYPVTTDGIFLSANSGGLHLTAEQAEVVAGRLMEAARVLRRMGTHEPECASTVLGGSEDCSCPVGREAQ